MMAALSPDSPPVRVGYGKPNSRCPRREHLTEINSEGSRHRWVWQRHFPRVPYHRCGDCDKFPTPERPTLPIVPIAEKIVSTNTYCAALTGITGWSAKEAYRFACDYAYSGDRTNAAHRQDA